MTIHSDVIYEEPELRKKLFYMVVAFHLLLLLELWVHWLAAQARFSVEVYDSPQDHWVDACSLGKLNN